MHLQHLAHCLHKCYILNEYFRQIFDCKHITAQERGGLKKYVLRSHQHLDAAMKMHMKENHWVEQNEGY